MENISYDELVEIITKEVIKRMNGADNSCGDCSGGKPLALVAGNAESLPQFAKDKYSFAPIDYYKGDISCYEAVFIAEMSFSELSDCALGKDSSKLSCAVVNALLSDKEVYLLEAGLPYKAYSRTAENRNIYGFLENSVNALRSFGVKIVKEQWQGKNFERNAVEDNIADRVITEKTAKELCEKCATGVIKLRCGTVITPSAKDVFNHSDIKVEFTD